MERQPCPNRPCLVCHRAGQIRRAVLVHCYHGADRTGIVIAMYRLIYQGWDIETARSEMKQGGYDFHKIWQNLDLLLSPIGVAQVRAEIDRLRELLS